MSSVVIPSIFESALSDIEDPYLGRDLMASGVVKGVAVNDNEIIISLRFGFPISAEYSKRLSKIIIHRLLPHANNKPIRVAIDWKINTHLAQAGLKSIAGVRNIIAVASGKGGVGKSTVALNLALSLQREGASVGILDADIYGPSQPLMLGINERPVLRADKRLEPVLKYDLQTMSIGYLVDEAAAMIWRGPMVSSALQQLLGETAWNSLDYLIVDLPPGTGDIQLTLAQKIPVSGVVVVTTPQEMALLDARKAIAMFQKLDISVLGVIENMSTYHCTHCGHAENIFGFEGGEKLSQQFGVPLLGRLPLDMHIREQSDLGVPLVTNDPNGSIAREYIEIARHMSAKLSLRPRDYRLLIKKE